LARNAAQEHRYGTARHHLHPRLADGDHELVGEPIGPQLETEGEGSGNRDAQTGYAPVRDRDMYYEIRGRGSPTLLLHRAYLTVELMGTILPGLAASRRVTAPEQQGHGRTADVDRPLTHEQMADDTAALVRHLELDELDVVGYSMGGGVALQMAIRHPGLVRAGSRVDLIHERWHARRGAQHVPSIAPELFAGSPTEEAYLRTTPNPQP
jgi:pimeloyl-ACP methyl ester carboxylesterase